MRKKQQHSIQVIQQQKVSSLQEIFREQRHLAWQVLDSESALYSETDTTLQKITYLTSLYMKIIEKLNTIQDPRECYFTYKMQKLMHEPYIIRCFNNQTNNKKNVLEDKKKQFEQKIEKQAERQIHKKVVDQAIIAQEQKEKKIRDKVKTALDQSHKKLEQRIIKRKESRLMSPKRASYAFSNGQLSSKTISSDQWGNRQQNSRQFELSIDQNDPIFRTMKRQLQAQENEQKFQRKLLRNFSLQEQK